MGDIVFWESEASETTAIVEECDPFVARGMRRVYGRGDHLGRYRTFYMDIWRDRRGRLFMRCWSRCSDIDWREFEIKGMDVDMIPEGDRERGFKDCWLPKAARDAYEEWIREEF